MKKYLFVAPDGRCPDSSSSVLSYGCFHVGAFRGTHDEAESVCRNNSGTLLTSSNYNDDQLTEIARNLLTDGGYISNVCGEFKILRFPKIP